VAWAAALSSTLLHVVREVEGGCRLLVAAMARAVADIKLVRACGCGRGWVCVLFV
jgi:hypothetical protein